MRRTANWLAVCSATCIGVAGLAPAADEEDAPKCGEISSAAYAGGSVTVEPGKTVCLRFSMVDGKATIAPASDTTSKDEVLVIELTADKSSTMLVIKNGTPNIIKYRAQFQVPGNAAWHTTSICPVQAGIMSIEQWPHAIQTLRLSDFRALPKDGDFVCD